MDPFKEAQLYVQSLPDVPFFEESKERLMQAQLGEDEMMQLLRGIKGGDAERVRQEVVQYIEYLPDYSHPKERLKHYLQQYMREEIDHVRLYDLYQIVKTNQKSGRQKALDFIQEIINNRGSREAINELRTHIHRHDRGLLEDAVLEQMVLKAKREYLLNLDNSFR